MLLLQNPKLFNVDGARISHRNEMQRGWFTKLGSDQSSGGTSFSLISSVHLCPLLLVLSWCCCDKSVAQKLILYLTQVIHMNNVKVVLYKTKVDLSR